MEENLKNIEILENQIKMYELSDELLCKKLYVLMLLYEKVEQVKKADEIALVLINKATNADNYLDKYRHIKSAYFMRARRHFDEYMIACEWNRVPKARFWLPRREVLEGKHHIATAIQNFIDDPNSSFLSISLPPAAGKSTLIKFLLAFIAGRYPMSTNMYCAYSDGMVRMMLDSERSILTDNNEYCHNEIFYENEREPDISAEYNTISYRRKGDFPTMGLISLGGSVTGRTRANKFLITDDLVRNAEMARSPERLEKLYSDYKATLTTRMIGDSVKQIMLGTIWSVHDPISRMMNEYGDDSRYKFIRIPVCDEKGNSNFEYDHPDNYSKKRIDDLRKSLDPVDFSCLYLQKPLEKAGLAFPPHRLKFYNGVLPDSLPDRVVLACDVAWGGGDSLSAPIAYVYGTDVYIHDVVFDKGDKTITKPRIIGKILQHSVQSGLFEANNGGDEYCADVSRILCDEKFVRVNLTSRKAPTNISKISRIEQHAPTIRDFYFLSSENQSEEYSKFMDELYSFSFIGKNLHDDAPDSLALLADMLFGHNRPNVVSVYRRSGNL